MDDCRTPGRFGTIVDVGDTVAWISSDQAAYITGQNILIGGGASLRRLPRAEGFMRAAKDAASS